jgi:hypothetical protein
MMTGCDINENGNGSVGGEGEWRRNGMRVYPDFRVGEEFCSTSTACT